MLKHIVAIMLTTSVASASVTETTQECPVSSRVSDPCSPPVATAIPWLTACGQQATAYCQAIGFPSNTGCLHTYETQCHDRSDVPFVTQSTCLIEIANPDTYCGPLGCGEPKACSLIWSP